MRGLLSPQSGSCVDEDLMRRLAVDASRGDEDLMRELAMDAARGDKDLMRGLRWMQPVGERLDVWTGGGCSPWG